MRSPSLQLLVRSRSSVAGMNGAMIRRGGRCRGIALLAIAGLLLTNCAPEPGEAGATDASGEPTAESSAPVTSAPPDPALALPADCGAVISDAELSELTREDQYLAPDLPSLEALPGPVARDVARTADERLDCLWWIVNVWEGSLPLFISRTSAEAQTALIDGLLTSTLYTETTVGGERAFTTSYTDAVAVHQVVYVFVEDVWIAVVAPTEPAVAVAIAERALASVTE